MEQLPEQFQGAPGIELVLRQMSAGDF